MNKHSEIFPHNQPARQQCNAADEHCITCSDEALPATVLSIDSTRGLALVLIEQTTAEIDITLLDDIVPGNTLLVHGGVALALA